MIHNPIPCKPVKLLHSNSTTTISRFNKSFNNVVPTNKYVENSNIPSIYISYSDSQTSTLSDTTLNMSFKNYKKCIIKCTVYDNANGDNLHFIEFYSTINNNTISISDEHTDIEIVLNSSTSLTINSYKHNYYQLIIDSILLYEIGETLTTFKLKESSILLRENLIDTNFNSYVDAFSISSIKYAKGTWVAVVRNDYTSNTIHTILYSYDGITWEQSNITTNHDSLFYANGIWLLYGGSDGGILYSQDGITWDTSFSSNYIISYCCYGNGQFVAISGANGAGIYYSTSGRSWTQANANGLLRSGGFKTAVYAKDLWIYGNNSFGLMYSKVTTFANESNITDCSCQFLGEGGGIFVACGGSSYGLLYSEDGKTWTQSNITTGWYRYFKYAKGIWVAGCNSSSKGLYYSEDGKTWTQSNITTGEFNGCCYGNNMWMAYCGNKLYYSKDGKIWYQTNIDNTSTSEHYVNLDYVNGKWLLSTYKSTYLGELTNGRYYDYTYKTYYLNTDKLIKHSNINSKSIADCIYANKLWVASCNSSYGLLYSEDGKTWTQSNITTGYTSRIYYNQGLFVCVSSTYGILYSYNGKTWSRTNITSATAYINYVVCYNNLWVASGNSGVYYSEDGKTWTQSNITSYYSYKPYYANGLWVIPLHEKGIAYSTNGKTWTYGSISFANMESVYYANGLWVACGAQGIYYSTNGKSWTQSKSISSCTCVHYANGVWVVSLADSTRSTRGLLYSEDGKTWTQSNIANTSIGFVTYKNNLWIACSLKADYTDTFANKGIYISKDGKLWGVSSLSVGDFTCVEYSNGIYVACNQGKGLFYLDRNDIENYKEVY